MVCVCFGEEEPPINRRHISNRIGVSWQFAVAVPKANKRDSDGTATSSGRQETGVEIFFSKGFI